MKEFIMFILINFLFSSVSFADGMSCYEDCVNEKTGLQNWQLLETGAQCTGGESKWFQRGHPSPDGTLWHTVRIEQFEGYSVAAISADHKQINVNTNCQGTELEKHRIYATYRMELTPNLRDEVHNSCIKKCQ